MTYLVNLIYDEEFKGYVADVPALPGCMSQGKSIEETTENIKEAISLYLEDNTNKVIHSKIYSAIVEGKFI
jgi:predicted RNase H-like HicB family nuclease